MIQNPKNRSQKQLENEKPDYQDIIGETFKHYEDEAFNQG